MHTQDNTIKVYDLITQKYAEKFFNDFGDMVTINQFLSMLPEKSKILDAGCGPGGFVKYAISRGFDVQGIDLSPRMLEIAKQKVKAKFSLMDMQNMSFPDTTFDAIVCTYTLIHTPSPQINKTLIEFNRVLKPKGFLYLAVFKGQEEKFIDEPLMKGQKIFTKYFTEPELEEQLGEAGFSTLKITESYEGGDMGAEELYVIAQKS
ncbi:MAG: class I SAM-dependent methyltransferase [Candidatus Woesearchaeota archaeon]